MTKPSIVRASLLKVVLGTTSLVASLVSPSTATAETSPTTLAETAAKALNEERFLDYAKLVHPDERERFRKFAIAVMDAAEEADVLHVIGGFFRDAASRDAIAKADSAEVLADFLKAMVEQVPDFAETKKDLTFQALGEVKEGDRLVHVVCKTGGPKASVVTCVADGDGWLLALPSEVQALMSKAGKLKNAKAVPQNPLAVLEMLAPDELVSVSVLGGVKEGDDLVWLVCRTGQRSGAAIAYRVDAYPIPKTDAAWPYLDPRRRRELEAGLLQSWRANQAARSALELP
jgi:rhodanese-related sulfurtransferase